jgi:hypothetical protein
MAEQVLPGSEGRWRRVRSGGVYWGEMAQSMYAHINKRIKQH